VVKLSDPVVRPYLESGLPFITPSFSHAAYVDQVAISDAYDDGWTSRSKRVLKIVSFPDPLELDGSSRHADARVTTSFRSLEDVPEEVLDKASHLFVEPELASIMITTELDELHTFSYA